MARTTKQKLLAKSKPAILPSLKSGKSVKSGNRASNRAANAKAASVKRDGSASRDVYASVTNRIIEQMERAARWEKPWTFGAPDGTNFARPVNLAGKPYRGINVPLLWSAGYASPTWGTFKAWQDKGACVRKGEKAARVLFWKKYEKAVKDDAGEDATDSFLVAREYCVFNVEQVDGYAAPVAEPVAPVTPEQRNLTAERFFAATGAKVRFGGGRAFYTTGDDHIQMPPFGSFVGTTTSTAAEAFYGTLAHETVHWTGHVARCNRQFGKRFGDRAYAFEELVAELGSAFLSCDLGITPAPRQDHANYLATWLEVLKDDKRAIFEAASKAEQAVRFLTELTGGAEAIEEPEDGDAIIAFVPVVEPIAPVVAEPVIAEPIAPVVEPVVAEPVVAPVAVPVVAEPVAVPVVAEPMRAKRGKKWRTYFWYRPPGLTYPAKGPRDMESAYLTWLVENRSMSRAEAKAHIDAMDRRKVISAQHFADSVPAIAAE